MQAAIDSNQMPSHDLPTAEDLYALLAANCRAQTTHAQTTDTATKGRDKNLNTAEFERQMVNQNAVSHHDADTNSAEQHLETRTTVADSHLQTIRDAVTQTKWSGLSDVDAAPLSITAVALPGKALEILSTRATDLMNRHHLTLLALRERERSDRQVARKRQLIFLCRAILISVLFLGGLAVLVNSIQTANSNTTAVSTSVTSAQTPVPLGSLRVGVEALVSTTDGSTLNLRDKPGKNGKIIAQMPTDTRVILVGGPQSADGSLWWNVQVLTSDSTTAIAKTGWCSEFDGKIQTLTVLQ